MGFLPTGVDIMVIWIQFPTPVHFSSQSPKITSNLKNSSESSVVKVLVSQSCLRVVWHHGLYPIRLLCPWNSPGRNTGVGSQPFPSPRDLPHPGIELGSPALQAYSLSSEPPGKPNLKNMYIQINVEMNF